MLSYTAGLMLIGNGVEFSLFRYQKVSVRDWVLREACRPISGFTKIIRESSFCSYYSDTPVYSVRWYKNGIEFYR